MTAELDQNNRPLKVIVLSPPVENSGGIGTLYRYARENFGPDVSVRFIDTRGTHKNAKLSIFNVIRAIFLTGFLRVIGKIDVVHLNLGARGAAYRKLTMLAWCSYILRLPCVVQLHSATFEGFMEKLPGSIRKIMLKILCRAEAILVLGNVWKTMMEKLGVPASKVKIFVMGVPELKASKESDFLKSSNQADSKHRIPTLVFAGELGERKGLPSLLQSLTEPGLEDVHLIVAGSGDLAPWRDMIEKNQLNNRVALLGLVPVALIHDLLLQVDGLILPSRAEGLPVSVLEGLSAGKVVLTTESGSLSEFIEDGVTAIVIASQNEKDIAAAIRKMLEGNNADVIGKQAKELWRQTFEVTETTRGLVGIWKQASKRN